MHINISQVLLIIVYIIKLKNPIVKENYKGQGVREKETASIVKDGDVRY